MFGFGKRLVLQIVKQSLSERNEEHRKFSVNEVARGITIGRSRSNTIAVHESMATSKEVSREHGRIVFDKGKLWYQDTSSVGTIIERGGHEWKLHQQPMELQQGDRLFFAFRGEAGNAIVGTTVTVEFIHL